MPELATKNQSKKGKNDPKEQRRPRQGRQYQSTSADKKPEKNLVASKVTVPEKPTYVDPGPEFYKNLKRETDEVLKITEEATSKYKQKEIQSNWAKYEIPIESYEEIDEQENMGADYEKLAETPLSIGGYFQFKHEKSWDINTEPSLYDKFFEIDMDNLNIAVQTTPFHERNCIDKSIFSETDIQNMNNRSTRFKQKFFKDKSYTTPELQAQEKILNTLKERTIVSDDGNRVEDKTIEEKCVTYSEDIKLDPVDSKIELTNKPDKTITKTEIITNPSTDIIESKIAEQKNQIANDSCLPNMLPNNIKSSMNNNISNTEENIKGNNISDPKKEEAKNLTKDSDKAVVDDFIFENPGDKIINQILENPVAQPINNVKQNTVMPIKDISSANEPKANPVIESPEDLEKWLDDFLDS